MEAGENGLTVPKIARHVFNSVNTFFEQVSYEEVLSDVRLYIKNNSRYSYSTIQHASIRGRYKLNMNSEFFAQQRLNFDEEI